MNIIDQYSLYLTIGEESALTNYFLKAVLKLIYGFLFGGVSLVLLAAQIAIGNLVALRSVVDFIPRKSQLDAEAMFLRDHTIRLTATYAVLPY